MTSPLHPIRDTYALIDRLQAFLPTMLDRRAVAMPAHDVVGDYVIESEGD